jgi:hypothetical protein
MFSIVLVKLRGKFWSFFDGKSNGIIELKVEGGFVVAFKKGVDKAGLLYRGFHCSKHKS